jgi:hypothetical protein
MMVIKNSQLDRTTIEALNILIDLDVPSRIAFQLMRIIKADVNDHGNAGINTFQIFSTLNMALGKPKYGSTAQSTFYTCKAS